MFRRPRRRPPHGPTLATPVAPVAADSVAPTSPPTVYAPTRVVTNIADCYFYHTMDIPGYGLVTGEWDLRGGEHQYLGGVDFAGKRVLEMGAASGFLTMYMERHGADVIAYDLSEAFS